MRVRKFLIITADDFGLHESINESVERASRSGVLTAASLMVAGPAAADAVRRAQSLPDLRVGLHLVLADGPAMLAPEGRINGRMFSNGCRYFALPGVRRQLEREIRAQFAAFARTGLPLDHVNAHKHFHLHPTILEFALRVGRDYGVSAIRVPDEPLWFAAQGRHWYSGSGNLLLKPWIFAMRARLRAAGMFQNDAIFGVGASGAMDEQRLLEILVRLPAGVTEIYLHPAMALGHAITPSMADYRHADEFAALMSWRVRAALSAANVSCGGYSDAQREFGGYARTA